MYILGLVKNPDRTVAVYACEFCGHLTAGEHFKDADYQAQVLSEMTCDNCGMCAQGEKTYDTPTPVYCAGCSFYPCDRDTTPSTYVICSKYEKHLSPALKYTETDFETLRLALALSHGAQRDLEAKNERLEYLHREDVKVIDYLNTCLASKEAEKDDLVADNKTKDKQIEDLFKLIESLKRCDNCQINRLKSLFEGNRRIDNWQRLSRIHCKKCGSYTNWQMEIRSQDKDTDNTCKTN